MDTTAIVQFIGIVLFSASVPNDPGVHAILPRLSDVEHVHYMGSAAPREPVTGIEDHVAVIMYRDEDRLSDSGKWKDSGSLKNQWKYVVLDGEQVQFLTNRANGTPVIPAALPHASPPGEHCPRTAAAPTLKAPFQAPLYKGAVGVFDIPFGKLDACITNTPSITERADTTLLMETEGVLVITAKKPTELVAKTITLDGDAVVYVANVPPQYLFTGEPPSAGGEPHFFAYSAMIDTDCPTRPELPTIEKPCDLSAISSAFRMARNKPPADFKLINSECSNSQLP